jgi:hypothetical protein
MVKAYAICATCKRRFEVTKADGEDVYVMRQHTREQTKKEVDFRKLLKQGNEVHDLFHKVKPTIRCEGSRTLFVERQLVR